MEFTARFKALNYTEENIGKLIKSSKKKFTWEFKMNSKHCVLELKISKMTNNYSVELNKQLLYKGNKSYDEHFEFKFKIEGIMLVIRRSGSLYTLYIQNKPFKEFYDNSKGRQTKLIKPEPTLHAEDFDNSSPEKRFKSMNVKPEKLRPIDTIMNNSTPLTPFNKNNEIKDVKELIKENIKNEGLNNQLKESNDIELKINQIDMKDEKVSEDDNPFDNEFRDRAKTFEFKGGNEKKMDVYHELESEHESEAEDNNNQATAGVNDNINLKESMNIIVYPNDFSNHDENTQNVIRVIYDKTSAGN